MECDMETESFESLKKRRKNLFDAAEKMNLIKEVKKHPCIWDTSNSKHCNNTAVLAAWRDVAAESSKTIDECKKAWASLRDSRRYHMSTSKKKSGDAGGVALGSPSYDDIGDWEFADALSFLPNIQKKRTTIKSFTFNLNSSSSQSSISSPLASTSQASLMSPLASTSQASLMSPLASTSESESPYRYSEDTTPKKTTERDELAKTLNTYFKSQLATTTDETTELKYKDKYMYFDSLLKKLPEAVVDELCFQFTDLIRNELRKN